MESTPARMRVAALHCGMLGVRQPAVCETAWAGVRRSHGPRPSAPAEPTRVMLRQELTAARLLGCGASAGGAREAAVLPSCGPGVGVYRGVARIVLER